jgi:hypothetical protein
MRLSADRGVDQTGKQLVVDSVVLFPAAPDRSPFALQQLRLDSCLSRTLPSSIRPPGETAPCSRKPSCVSGGQPGVPGGRAPGAGPVSTCGDCDGLGRYIDRSRRSRHKSSRNRSSSPSAPAISAGRESDDSRRLRPIRAHADRGPYVKDLSRRATVADISRTLTWPAVAQRLSECCTQPSRSAPRTPGIG